MGASKTQITNFLEMRYDYQSARNVLVNWRKAAKIKEDLDSFDDNQLRSLLDYLKENASEATRVHAAIERLILNQESQPVHEIHEEPAPIEEPVVEEHAYIPEEAPVEEAAPVEENQEQAENQEQPAEDQAPADNASGKKKNKKKK